MEREEGESEDGMSQLRRDRTESFVVGGLKVTAEISPCSFMYAQYGLQVQFKLPTDGAGNGGEFMLLKKAWASCVDKDFNTMVTQMRGKLEDGGLKACPACNAMTWNRGVFPNQYRNEKCEQCFLGDLKKEFRVEQTRERKRIERMDSKRKKEGYTHRVEAWIHAAQGDDKQVGWYWRGEPKDSEIRAKLTAAGSEVVTDFKVVAL